MNYLDELAQQIKGQLDDEELPQGETNNLFRMYAVLVLAKGTEVTREDVHNAWVTWMLSKDQQHESMVPFAALPNDVKNEDSPFVRAIREVARSTRQR